jgi:transposase-like protein
MEIITGIERRRNWPLEQKLAVLAEASHESESAASVARRHDIRLASFDGSFSAASTDAGDACTSFSSIQACASCARSRRLLSMSPSISSSFAISLDM